MSALIDATIYDVAVQFDRRDEGDFVRFKLWREQSAQWSDWFPAHMLYGALEGVLLASGTVARR